MSDLWIRLILLTAPWLIVMPAAIRTLRLSRSAKTAGLLTAASLCVSQFLNPGWAAGILAGGWLLFSLQALRVAYQQGKKPVRAMNLAAISTIAAFLYLCIGGLWAVADRLGIRPLHFDPVIVLLTAVHFHYAGFALCWVSGQVAAHTDGRWEKRWAALPVLGVPLTAVGITTSQLGQSPLIEMVSVVVMAASGIAVAYLQLKLAFSSGQAVRTRLLWGVAGLALMAGMSLAVAYGLRYYFPLPWLSIPFMYALHGSLNSLGFAVPAIFGWLTQARLRN